MPSKAMQLFHSPLRALAASLLICLFATEAVSQSVKGVATHQGFHFVHHDWEVACDNTRTCRAAGYQSDEAELPVSLLLVREAGPGAPVQAQLMLGDTEMADGEVTPVSSRPAPVHLRVNGRRLGALPWLAAHKVHGLSPAQLQAVLEALPKARAQIEVLYGDQVFSLSDRGAHAVPLKMDEAQGRVGTPGALVRRGARPERDVLPPLPPPVVYAARVPMQTAGADQERLPGLSSEAQALLERQLTGSAAEARPELDEPEHEPAFRYYPLGGGAWLATTVCWTAAYNRGECMWVIRARPPHRPVLVTDMALDYQDGVITASHKGRGVGDCWSHEDWTWDGRAFVQTRISSTGMCKVVAAGGTWDLPTLVTRTVRP
ncbi:DUF1176 domain-containing protein [Aquabacterium fontiphilum]|uniref:DUF1176 domain-containing protein n=1 Tax=Aquabacterium fontiphilum TaxID=450365 RepID=UPI001377F3FD|nr:DUF1176 domain-containing protein [Aquabacterium fontiphilum]NBD19099.1 DUF1176 domain-containing protein [Aquabacterium fontiphilum]